ncbi:MAG: hypothetical protein ACRCWJ_20690 [Casimicrobium sp.]
MSDDFDGAQRIVFIVAHLAPDDLRELIRAELAAGLAKDREMRKLELLASLKREPETEPRMSLPMRAALAWDVLCGKGGV